MESQTITVNYDSLQDRIVVFVRGAVSSYALQLTRRFTFAMLAALSRQVQNTQGDTRLAKAGLQDELLSMKHVHAVSQIRNAQAEAPSSPLPPLQMPAEMPIHLTSRVDIRHDSDGATTLLFFVADETVGKLVFQVRELHWFLERLLAHGQQAGWSDAVPVPAWLTQQSVDEAASSAPVTPTIVH